MAFDARPLHNLTCKGVPWYWSEKCDAAFEILRSACLDNIILAAPDYTKPVCVAGDASDEGKGVQAYELRSEVQTWPLKRRAGCALLLSIFKNQTLKAYGYQKRFKRAS